MKPRFEGMVALVTGAARGQGRNHARRLALEGADIIAVDICRPVPQTKPTANSEDLAETVRLIEAAGRRVIAGEVDVRDLAALQQFVDHGVESFGRLDVVIGNAGVSIAGAASERISEEAWQAIIDVNLSGVWHTCKVAIPHLDGGGAIVLTSSVAGVKGLQNISAYTAAKHGVTGLMRSLAQELGPRMIRANAVVPGMVATDMIMNEDTYGLFNPQLESPTVDDLATVARTLHLLPEPWVEVDDISNAALFLASAEARYITGVVLPVDLGATAK